MYSIKFRSTRSFSSVSCGPDRSSFLDATDTFSWHGGNLNVALVTIVCSPRVSDNVEVLGSLATPTNSCDCMVNSCSAGLIVQNSCLILSKRRICSDANRSWTFFDGSFHVRNGLCLTRIYSKSLNNSSHTLALSGYMSVRVRSLQWQSMILSIIHRGSWVSSIAATACAIDKHLFRKAQKFPSFDEMVTFDGGNG